MKVETKQFSKEGCKTKNKVKESGNELVNGLLNLHDLILLVILQRFLVSKFFAMLTFHKVGSCNENHGMAITF